MTVLGHSTTVLATMEEMLMLTRAVTRGAERALVVADMPFGLYQVSDEDAVKRRASSRGGSGRGQARGRRAEPPRGRPRRRRHPGDGGTLGLTPQSATMLGGFRAQGKTAEKARELLEDALVLERAGCFAVVLEAVPAPVAERISDELGAHDRDRLRAPPATARVLVLHDLLGPSPTGLRRGPRSATPEIGADIQRVRSSASRPRSGDPAEEHTYAMPADEQEARSSARRGRQHERNVRTKIASTARATATAPRSRRQRARRPRSRRPAARATRARRRPRPGRRGAGRGRRRFRPRAERVRSVDEQPDGPDGGRARPPSRGWPRRRGCRARR